MQNYSRNDEAPGLVSVVVIDTTVCNIFGDWLLIFPIQWGTKGAAIVTGISQTIGMFIILRHFIQKRNTRLGKIKPEGRLLSDILIHGLPEGISQLAMPVMILYMNHVLVEMIGDIGANVFAVMSYVASFSIAIFAGTSEGVRPLFDL